MSLSVTLALSGDQHDHLQSFLFPGDGKEAAAILLCGHRNGDRRQRLVVREIHGIPYEACSERTEARVTWHPDTCADIFERAAEERLSVLKIHSHPSGYPAFSETDDLGDNRLLPMIRSWVEHDVPHGSVVMLPDGQMFGRLFLNSGEVKPIDCISVASDNLHFWYSDRASLELPSFTASHAQAFGQGTTERLSRLSVGIVGASGTGSPVIEQFVRLGAGEVVCVDDDQMEYRNVNRILNSTLDDVQEGKSKVDVVGDAAERTRLPTRIIRLKKNLWNPDVVRSIAQCDVLFGCMDTIDGRYLLNVIATHYSIPYFDIGVRLVAETTGSEKGRIREVCGTVNFLRPGRSSLMSRGLFSMSEVAAAGLRRNDPTAHERQVEDGYIQGVQENRPAVISVNMFAASLAVSEFLARLHPYREEPNGAHAAVTFSLASMELISDPEEGFCPILSAHVGRGDVHPLLGLMELMQRSE